MADHVVDVRCCQRLSDESQREVSAFLTAVLRSRRTVLCAGFGGSEPWS
jgi:hypothetical protein